MNLKRISIEKEKGKREKKRRRERRKTEHIFYNIFYNKEYIYLIADELGKKQILKVSPFSLGLYYTYISPIQTYCSSKR